jgi:hypothetical protein
MGPLTFAQTGCLPSFPFPQRGHHAVPEEFLVALDVRLQALIASSVALSARSMRPVSRCAVTNVRLTIPSSVIAHPGITVFPQIN